MSTPLSPGQQRRASRQHCPPIAAVAMEIIELEQSARHIHR